MVTLSFVLCAVLALYTVTVPTVSAQAECIDAGDVGTHQLVDAMGNPTTDCMGSLQVCDDIDGMGTFQFVPVCFTETGGTPFSSSMAQYACTQLPCNPPTSK